MRVYILHLDSYATVQSTCTDGSLLVLLDTGRFDCVQPAQCERV